MIFGIPDKGMPTQKLSSLGQGILNHYLHLGDTESSKSIKLTIQVAAFVFMECPNRREAHIITNTNFQFQATLTTVRESVKTESSYLK